MSTTQPQPRTVRGYRDPAARPNRPAEPRGTAAPTAWQQRVPGPQVPGFVTGVTMVTGLWLLLAPSVWNYGDTGGGFDARWNDLAIGLVIGAVGAARLARRIRLAVATAVSVVSGLWLMVAPLALSYGFGTDSTRATLNDVIAGVLIVGVAALGHVSARMTLATRL